MHKDLFLFCLWSTVKFGRMSSSYQDNQPPCPRITGDTKWINHSPEYAMELFLKTGGGSERHHRNPLTENFFSPQNVAYIVKQIEAVLEKLTGGQKVRVPFNDELVQTMWEVAKSNVGLTYVPGVVAILNRQVVQHEAEILYSSLLRRKLWIKYYLNQDRMRVMPYGELTKGTKGDDVISPSGYMLSDPWSRFRKCYLRDAEGICCDENTGEYRHIEGFLEPKKKPMGLERSSQMPSEIHPLANMPAPIRRC